MIFFDHAERPRDLPAWFASREVEEARRQIDAFLSLAERERAQTDPDLRHTIETIERSLGV